MILPIFAAVAPVLITAAVGFAWVRMGRAFETSTLRPLVVDIATPCLIFATLEKTSISPAQFTPVALASIAAIACFALVGGLALRLTGFRVWTFLQALTFPNNGNLGLAGALYAFGQERTGLCDYLLRYRHDWPIHGRTRHCCGRRELARHAAHAIIYAVALGVPVSVWGLPLPGWFSHAISLIGGMTIPLMVLMLGASLARLPLQRISRALGLAGLRIGLGPQSESW
jgi:malate permease and related proteins